MSLSALGVGGLILATLAILQSETPTDAAIIILCGFVIVRHMGYNVNSRSTTSGKRVCRVLIWKLTSACTKMGIDQYFDLISSEPVRLGCEHNF